MDHSPTDKDLLERIRRAGDDAAFATLVRRYDPHVYRFLVRATRDPEAAKDIRQESFIRVYRYASSYDDRYAVSTWIFRIVLNRLHTWRSAQGRLRTIEIPIQSLPDAPTAQTSPGEDAIRDELFSALRTALDRLPDGDRELLLLRFQLNLSYPEIAAIADAPETTVKSRVYAILNRLRTPLAPFAQPARRAHP